MPAIVTERQPVRDWPLYWFAELERAIAVGEYQQAAAAQAELARLGVSVRFQAPPKTEAPR